MTSQPLQQCIKNTIVKMSEESKKGIYNQSSFDAIKPRLNGTKPKYSATPMENRNDALGRRDAQFENHWLI